MLQPTTLSFFKIVLGIERDVEYQRFDGYYNNLASPKWGRWILNHQFNSFYGTNFSVGSRLYRDAPSNYEDGVYKISSDLPSARAISGSGRISLSSMIFLLRYCIQRTYGHSKSSVSVIVVPNFYPSLFFPGI